MNEKIKKKLGSALFIISLVLIILVAVVYYEVKHPKFDAKVAGKDATVVKEVAKIHYDDPFGRNVDTVTESQKFELTGKMAYVRQSDIIMMEILLEDNHFAWISKKDVIISK
ncbi:MAG: hypothetical protein HFJ34_05500 [Clostridia bacterium]|nr:hypothetical protein [Clostridia bacterium]